ncbi:EAL domain-containing protein [Marinobacter salinisoli]|uniref:EAL domain-containing protein n=1 Tax=Marinobacter salinisoli TaxID=2769486 RepID=A0ABX7MVR3_9GAMM|nr:EAL domain-containing protein [Marinobacter salinisoli]QSP96361.1 EAL domain-containing protein [Marinobacter salinisoli]
MAIPKRNIWKLFLLVYAVAFVFLLVLLFASWKNTVSEYERRHESRAELFAQAVDSIFTTQEMALDVIGRELIRHGELEREPHTMPLLDSIVASSASLVGLGLANVDGELVALSSNLDPERVPNLREFEQTRADFERALDEKKMVLGRTYFVESIQEWVIPVRKALRNREGEVLAVMTGGVRIDGESGIFRSVLHEGENDSIMLFRERDGYLQYVSRAGVGPEIYTTIRRTQEEVHGDVQLLVENSGKSISEVRSSGDAVTYFSSRDSGRYIGAAVFEPRFELWIISETESQRVLQTYLNKLMVHLILFLCLTALLYYLFSLIDRIEKKRIDSLFRSSRSDELTGLKNRLGLMDSIQRKVDDERRFSLILVDIDNFRGVNDRFGQEFGDAVLIEMARCLCEAAGEGNLVNRLSGDEFAVVTELTRPDDLDAFCRNLLVETGLLMAKGRLELQLGASAGAAIFPEHGDSFDAILRNAHLALYRAKKNRNDICLFQPDIESSYLRRVHIEQRLRGALERNEIVMAYQPQFDAEGNVLAVEALARWHDEELGDVPPSEFVEVAESSGLMVQLGNYILDRSLKQFSQLLRANLPACELAVNISVLQFMQPDFADTVMEKLREHQVSPSDLTLEITESLFMSRRNQILPVLNRLRAMGIRLAMDDFGTGYSSLSLLRALPIDELKVDKSFVDHINDDIKACNMIESIVAIARTHSMDLVAEGVEQKDQADRLIDMGCGRLQGYYYSRPVSMDKVQALLTSLSDSMSEQHR